MKVERNGAGGGFLGAYRVAVSTGLLTVLAANDCVFSLRWTSTAARFLLEHLRLIPQIVTPFTAANEVNFEAFIARSFTVSDGAGNALTLTGNNQKLATTFESSFFAAGDMRVSAAAAVTPGTRTVDAQPIARAQTAQVLAAAAAADIAVPFDYTAGVSPHRFPVQLVANEGLVVQNQVLMGAAGTVRLGIEIEWSEWALLPG